MGLEGRFSKRKQQDKIYEPPSMESTTQAQNTMLPSTKSSLSQYQIIKELGRGGMGVVYQVMDTKLERVAAAKMLLEGGLKEASIKRFMREAELSAKMSHPNIVHVYDFGAAPSFYIIMEFIEGRLLEDLLKDKEYPLRKKLEIFWQVCNGVEYAHQQKIIHRDLKPQNIMVTTGNVAKIMDFGLAKSLVLQSMKLSKTGQVMGTLKYMSPEQAEGQKLDHKTDIYSLGVILYKILTGRTPYESDNEVNILAQLAEAKPMWPSEIVSTVPKKLEAICMKCLEKEPGDRYESARELGEHIHAYLENKPVVVSQITMIEKSKRWMKRNSKLAAICIALLVCWGVFGWLEKTKSPDNSYGLPPEVWKECHYQYQGEVILDMTTEYWCRLLPIQQSQYASQYQKGYAAAKNLALEKEIPIPNLPPSAKPLVMRLIPPGRFWMGSPAGELARDQDEGPRHRVVISSPYYLSKYECTQAQWKAVMGKNPSDFLSSGQDAPVENVSWNDVANGSSSFCGKTGLQLPSEAAWEYTCRAGTIGAYSSGQNSFGSIAWHDENSEDKTHPVGQKNPNGFGVHDMCGNVLEWCQDWYSESYESSGEVTNPTGASHGKARVLRGGSWDDDVEECRSAYRNWDKPNECCNLNGFRVVANSK